MNALLNDGTADDQTSRLADTELHPVWKPDEPERILICKECQHLVTTTQERIAVRGDHEHTFFNPHGILFHLGCFQRAHGCITDGAPSLEFTWFAGYAWLLASCMQCRQHLGWKFMNREKDTFFALILSRLQERPSPL
ncbi:MAG: hypothetical protein HQL96_05725 [Magnetococcales bacterium]|nr:hypothetical protein [Magnetococcales bacterium]